jgi:hypothetical protein
MERLTPSSVHHGELWHPMCPVVWDGDEGREGSLALFTDPPTRFLGYLPWRRGRQRRRSRVSACLRLARAALTRAGFKPCFGATVPLLVGARATTARQLQPVASVHGPTEEGGRRRTDTCVVQL